MKKILLASALLLATASFASAEQATTSKLNGFYVSPKIGYSYEKTSDFRAHSASNYSKVSSDSDSTYAVGIAVGYDFAKSGKLPIRTELEYMYRDNADWEKTIGVNSFKMETSMHTLGVNTYYDFKTSTKFTPFVGAGIGIAFIDSSALLGTKVTDSNEYVTWNLQAGTNYEINAHNSVGIGYRYSDLGESVIKRNSITLKASHNAHEIIASYTYAF